MRRAYDAGEGRDGAPEQLSQVLAADLEVAPGDRAFSGAAWTSSSEPGFLEGVAVTSPDNAWAVGGSNWFDPDATVVYHWNGSDWDRQPSPNPPSGGYLNSVAATSASDAWAVGQTGPGPGGGTGPSDRTLIEHWNGTAWTTMPSLTSTTTGGLTRVAAVSASDAWAVGTTTAGPALHGVILHWNSSSTGTAACGPWCPVPTGPT